MKVGIQAGFALLSQGKYNQALTCFKKRLGTAKTKQDINTCLYGKARAQIGLKNYAVAISILEGLIASHPAWEVPYITLARMYEDRKMIEEAERTYLKAVNDHKARSKKFFKCYEWFLEHHLLPLQLQQQAKAPCPISPQGTFTPGWQMQRRRQHAKTTQQSQKPAHASVHKFRGVK
ncbi:MAG: tetratricopeptide repeat protein [Proteobacteria bacterium]|nr:tetratricopeptide repeat protein [Pseudomonadota bacterium]